ncbi:MAG: hypothetical protein CMM49_08155 [Rhodospirillaceae bacterium]|nr:hypothetical protein [Rhodospirillaceae bacterium]|tara:strand:+ start:4027 stop:4503 length:477 start_codon:yes stop_codon:yes gene_type:complete
MSIRIIIIYFLFITYLASCSNTQDSKKIGQVLGAISGTIIGSKLGKGAGKNFYTASGAIVGSIIGKNLGEIISKTDIDYISSKTGEVLNDNEIGKKYSWKNSETGNSGYVKTERKFKNQNQNCKEIKQVIKIKEKIKEIYSTACEQSDGSWRISKLDK